MGSSEAGDRAKRGGWKSCRGEGETHTEGKIGPRLGREGRQKADVHTPQEREGRQMEGSSFSAAQTPTSCFVYIRF